MKYAVGLAAAVAAITGLAVFMLWPVSHQASGHVVFPGSLRLSGCAKSQRSSCGQLIVHERYADGLFAEGAVNELTLTSARGAIRLGNLLGGKSVTSPALPAGRYMLNDAVRPCDANCSHLSSAIRCSGPVKITARANTTVIVIVQHVVRCRIITISPRSQASQRARLVARKLREAHRQRAHSAGAALTYPAQGVQVGAPSAQALRYAAASGLSTSSAAVAGFRQDRAAQGAFGSAITSGDPTAALATVTEQYPVTAGVSAGVPYQAWVLSVRGPAAFYGGPHSRPPPAGLQCDDVGIYDLQLSKWTELLQSCPATTDLRRPPATTTTLVVPQVTNARLDVAYARLHRTGLRVRFTSAFSDGDAPDSPCLPTIERQVPRGARHVRSGSVVTLRLRRRLCSVGSPGVPIGRLPSAKVPLFVGRPIATAVAWADRHNLYWQVDQLPPITAGNAPDLIDNYRVSSQQPSAGSILAFGIAKGGGNQGSFTPTPLILRGEPANHQ